jgi:TRAP-type mannitol/chloroaromatic compound transport system permease small subunit
LKLHPRRMCLDRWIGKVIAMAKWLVLPVALLLLVQWPLREVVQRYSREANDFGQLLFALYVAVALTCASRKGTHLATDVLSHHYPSRVRSTLVRAGIALAVVPWTLYVLATSAPTVWRSIVALEAFPETYNPGYFVVKVAVWVLAGLLLLQALVGIFVGNATGRDS